MYDIDFFERAHGLKDDILAGKFMPEDAGRLFEAFEALRKPEPYVFNVETTNYCNMRCIMCPRTTLMTRKNQWIDGPLFENVLDQMTPHDPARLEAFWKFIEQRYGISDDTRTEDGFYFHVVAKSLILHGYGEPLLDKFVVERVAACSQRGIPTYFSCVPANIDLEKIEDLFKAGLGVLKFSVDALDDAEQKRIRGNRNDFTKSFENIKNVIELKKQGGYQTKIVVTLIALGAANDDLETQRAFMKLFEPMGVFHYVKSQDNRWYFEQDDELRNKSHYVSQYCEFPWTSMTVMANGKIVPCTQDFDAEMVMGDAASQNLKDIWNGAAYQDFRLWHLTGNFPKGCKCNERCDLPKVYQRLAGKG